LSVERKFDAIWKGLAGVEQEASYQLEYKTLESAIEGLIRHFGKGKVKIIVLNYNFRNVCL